VASPGTTLSPLLSDSPTASPDHVTGMSRRIFFPPVVPALGFRARVSSAVHDAPFFVLASMKLILHCCCSFSFSHVCDPALVMLGARSWSLLFFCPTSVKLGCRPSHSCLFFFAPSFTKAWSGHTCCFSLASQLH
jgi:hypothetical protein